MRLISNDSPLARIPAALHEKQRAWLEGVRFSVEILDLKIRRLIGTLAGLLQLASNARDEVAQEKIQVIAGDAYSAAIADAWTALDAAWRLKRFLIDGRFPMQGISPPVPPSEDDVVLLRPFRDALNGVKKLRDQYQHLDNNVDSALTEAGGVWGFVSWVTGTPADHTKVHSHLLVPNSTVIGETYFPMVNPAGKTMHGPIDHVTINAFGLSVSLSELHRGISSVIKQLETVLRPQFSGHEPAKASFLITLTLSQ